MKKGSGVSYIHGPAGGEKRAQLTPVLSRVRDNCLQSLMLLLQSMFDGIDDSFFELANAARSNNEQNRYFEAMREVRIKRRGIETSFQQEITHLFASPPEPKSSTKSSIEEASFDTLTLVQDDALEESVAIASMTSKLRANQAGPLLQFQTRISQAYETDPKQSAVNPLDPDFLCKAFASACGSLDIDIREKLIVYKQFDRYVLGNFGDVLEAANRLLIQAGILPNLKYSGRKSVSTPAFGSPSTHAAPTLSHAQPKADHRDDGEDLLAQFHALFASLRHTDHAAASRVTATTSDPTQAIGAQDLLALLSGLQKRVPTQEYGDDGVSNIDLRVVVADLLSEQSWQNGTPSALNQIDEDLINLVSMLFEFILDDYNLSAPVQVLISRLQIPILKVVIKDKNFFNKTSHPARKLLNSLAKAGIGWSDISEKKRDKLYEQIHMIVQRILNDYDGDTALYEELYQQFSSFLEREERKAKLVEQRTKESEEGRIKSQKAQVTVDRILADKLNTPDLPAVAIDILRNGWSRVMFLAYLKDDTEHRWNQTVNTVDELIWCLQPHSDLEERQRWVRVVPQLLKTLKTNLKEVSYNTSKLEQMLVDLKQALTEVFKQQPTSAAIKDATKVSAQTQEAPEKPRAKTGIERQQEVENAELAEHLARIDEIECGRWIEFALVNGSKFRCKLSTKINDDEYYIFVNRMGLKVVEKTRHELAHELRRGRIQVLDEGLLFDRAMHTIMSNLRKAAG